MKCLRFSEAWDPQQIRSQLRTHQMGPLFTDDPTPRYPHPRGIGPQPLGVLARARPTRPRRRHNPLRRSRQPSHAVLTRGGPCIHGSGGSAEPTRQLVATYAQAFAAPLGRRPPKNHKRMLGALSPRTYLQDLTGHWRRGVQAAHKHASSSLRQAETHTSRRGRI